VKGLCPILLEILKLKKEIRFSDENAKFLTSLVVDIYVASTVCPVFSIAPDNAPVSLRLKPLSAAPRSA
jgi:hypothetical protein